MRNKKYRPVKLWLILGLVLLITPLSWSSDYALRKYLSFFCFVGLLLVLILCFTYWFEVKEDRIIIRHGLSSFDKQYSSNFKTRTIMICDINSIDIRDSGKVIIISLKNGSSVCFPIGGYFHHSEIIRLFYEVKKQIYK